MKNYRNQKSCPQCKHVFVKYDFEDGPYYYCTYNAPPRPPCDSMAMTETSLQLKCDPIELETNWLEWSKDKTVEPFGICDLFEMKV
jgi:hypothetical protein